MVANTIILVDWENFRRDIKQTKCVNYNIALDVIATIRAFLLDDERISRIYFYTTPPFDFEQALWDKKNDAILNEKNPGTEMKIFTSNDIKEILQSNEAIRWDKIYKDVENFQHDLASLDHVELRLGRTKLHAIRMEFDRSYRALLEQKQVDMLMGLDIQRIAFKKIADRILVFSKDTDLLPALKIARNEGLRVDIADLSDRLSLLSHDLKCNSDKVRVLSSNEVKDKLFSIRENLTKTNWALN
ncbi:NYN domain-containing protein [Helicobacter acinonychis]|uniref:NYN domain-containing protein n=1 Tax=Helicobacter acinonychis TaxID=212 RepID=UPI000CF055E7|nr:NYN domain-containing protein [Helicobacter acinonychis]